MSTFLSSIRQSVARAMSRLQFRRQIFNQAGRAGPRRLVGILLSGVAIIVLVVWVSSGGSRKDIVSKDALLTRVDPLPAGLHSTPEQDALSLQATDTDAAASLAKGVSYTPPLLPSQLVRPQDPPGPKPQPRGHPVRPAAHHPAASPPIQETAFVFPANPTAPIKIEDLPPSHPLVTDVAATVDPKAEAPYTAQINDMFSRWGTRAPRTDIWSPPAEATGGDRPEASAPAAPALRATQAVVPVALPAHGDEGSRVLIPAGRGIYAHSVLALSSDAASPVLLQADSGPITGDRMIGGFSKEAKRLIIHINSIEHRGEMISVDGIVIAPDTMEASVASGFDEHYVERFALPAAAAFVAGLGQVIATTSDTTQVLSPLGGATTSTHLNLDQQLGVAAGSAASQIASTLAQEVPHGPTITLDANLPVGVLFLSNVVARRGSK